MGKFQRNPFILAIMLFPIALTPKPATTGVRLGKIEWETVYHGDRETNRDPIGETIWIGEMIRIGETRRDGSCRPNFQFRRSKGSKK